MKFDTAEIRKRLQPRAALAVTIESGRIAVDHVQLEREKPRVVKSFVLPIGADAVMAGAEKIGKDLAAKLEAEGIRERRCVVGIPANWALTATTEVPAVGAEDLRGYLELRAEREFPIPVSEVRLAFCAYDLPDGEKRATLAGVAAKRIDAVERLLAAAHCRAVSISLGLDSCVEKEKTDTKLHFLANGNHVDLVVAAGGGIAAVRTLPAPAGENAESFDPVGFSREVRITLGKLPGGLRNRVTEANFCGSPSTAQSLCNEVGQHLQRLGISSRFEKTGGSASADHPGAAVESAGQFLTRKPVAFEFLTPEESRWEIVLRQLEDKRRRWILFGIIAALLLPIVAYFVRSHIESSLNKEWNGMRTKVADLEALQQGIRAYRPWFETSPQVLRVLEDVVGAFPESGDVWAKSVQIGEANKVVCTGFARNQPSLVGLLDRLRNRKDITAVQVQQVRGDNPIQFSITFKVDPHDAN